MGRAVRPYLRRFATTEGGQLAERRGKCCSATELQECAKAGQTGVSECAQYAPDNALDAERDAGCVTTDARNADGTVYGASLKVIRAEKQDVAPPAPALSPPPTPSACWQRAQSAEEPE